MWEEGGDRDKGTTPNRHMFPYVILDARASFSLFSLLSKAISYQLQVTSCIRPRLPWHDSYLHPGNSAIVGILLTPVMHRTLQRFHFDADSTKTEQQGEE